MGFTLTAPARTLFGEGCRAGAVAEISELAPGVLLIRGRSVAWVDDLEHDLRAAGCTVETVFSAGEPDIETVRAGVRAARARDVGCVVAVGGGATIDLGKAISGLAPSDGDVMDHLGLGAARAGPMSTPLPFVAIPTTAGTGAEATRNAVIGVPDRQLKISLRDPRLVARLAIVDPELTHDAPRSVTLATGLDAITQLIESYLSCRANPVTDALCQATLPSAIAALARVMEAEDPDARACLSKASYLSGLALANAGLGVVHGLASVIGARGGAHGAICGRLLAGALVVNRAAMGAQDRDRARIDEINGLLLSTLDRGGSSQDGPRALTRFVDHHGLPTLSDFGVPEDDDMQVATAAATASSTQANPVALDVEEIRSILRQTR